MVLDLSGVSHPRRRPLYGDVFGRAMSLTTDRNDPRLSHGIDTEPVEQAKVYLILSDEERAKGFVRAYRDRYTHVGQKPTCALRDLTDEEHERYDKYDYVAFEAYPVSSQGLGRFWTQAQLDAKGCGILTVMGQALSETYAREPSFYGATYCVGCRMHKPVAEFVWDDGEAVGS